MFPKRIRRALASSKLRRCGEGWLLGHCNGKRTGVAMEKIAIILIHFTIPQQSVLAQGCLGVKTLLLKGNVYVSIAQERPRQQKKSLHCFNTFEDGCKSWVFLACFAIPSHFNLGRLSARRFQHRCQSPKKYSGAVAGVWASQTTAAVNGAFERLATWRPRKSQSPWLSITKLNKSHQTKNKSACVSMFFKYVYYLFPQIDGHGIIVI